MKSKSGQLKIQQMAVMLLAITLFFVSFDYQTIIIKPSLFINFYIINYIK